MFISILKHMLGERGLRISDGVAREFYLFLMKVSPWFPEDGSLTLEDWKKVGKEMRRYTAAHGEEAIPKQAYPIWLQMREILTERSDLVLLTEETASMENESIPCLDKDKHPSYGSTNKPTLTMRDDSLDPADEADLEEEAAKYELEEDRDHHRDFPVVLKQKSRRPVPAPRRRKLLPPVGFQGAMAQAREEGDTSFTFPVVYTRDSDDEKPQ